MFDWLGTLWDTIVDATSSVDWGEVGSDALTTSLAGAAIGGLASAVSDGDIGEGLLYGAAGGLVSGGLMEFGSQFADEWNWAGNQVGDYEVPEALEVEALLAEDATPTEFYLSEPEVAEAPPAPPAPQTVPQYVQYVKPDKSWMEVLGPTALQVGGGMLAGAFAPDPVDTQKELLKANWDREDEKGRRASGALASIHTPRGVAVIDKSRPVREDFAEIKEAVTA